MEFSFSLNLLSQLNALKCDLFHLFVIVVFILLSTVAWLTARLVLKSHKHDCVQTTQFSLATKTFKNTRLTLCFNTFIDASTVYLSASDRINTFQTTLFTAHLQTHSLSIFLSWIPNHLVRDLPLQVQLNGTCCPMKYVTDSVPAFKSALKTDLF